MVLLFIWDSGAKSRLVQMHSFLKWSSFVTDFVLYFLCPVMNVYCHRLKRRAQSRVRRVWNEVKNDRHWHVLGITSERGKHVIRSFLSQFQQKRLLLFHVPFDLKVVYSTVFFPVFNFFPLVKSTFGASEWSFVFINKQQLIQLVTKCEHISSLHFVP